MDNEWIMDIGLPAMFDQIYTSSALSKEDFMEYLKAISNISWQWSYWCGPSDFMYAGMLVTQKLYYKIMSWLTK